MLKKETKIKWVVLHERKVKNIKGKVQKNRKKQEFLATNTGINWLPVIKSTETKVKNHKQNSIDVS